MTKIFFVYEQTNDRVTPQRLPYYFGVIESYPTIVLPTQTVLPGVTLVLVGGPILTPSSNPALRGVNLEVVGGKPLVGLTILKETNYVFLFHIIKWDNICV